MIAALNVTRQQMISCRKTRIIVLPILLKRFMCNEVRVRFAPSPTGHLHLGGLRTALYNYLFAKSCNGKFVLRIEDTDQTRLVPESEKKLEHDLNWFGIYPDESPMVGGPYGPYKQSERLELYRNQVKHLLENKTAYYCFCSERRLDLLRREAVNSGQIPRYDNRCRSYSEEDINKKLDQGERYCIRFKLSNATSFRDLIYGNISYDVSLNEGDPIILKGDGFPTYHLANVIDDHFMNITHVLRGVEWQISTGKHILLYRAFGWEPPAFGHLPLILNSDGSKLSKRQKDITVESYKNNGIFPQALLNFVTQAGGGFTRHMDKLKPKIFTMGDLINEFDIVRINCNSCCLVPEKLPEFNQLEIQFQLKDVKATAMLVAQVREIVQNTFCQRFEENSIQLDDEHIRSILHWSQNRIHKLTDLVHNNLAFLWITPPEYGIQESSKYLSEKGMLEVLVLELKKCSQQYFNKEHLKQLLYNFSNANNLEFGKFMKAIRRMLSGLKEGPGVAEMMEILGPDRTISRLQRVGKKS